MGEGSGEGRGVEFQIKSEALREISGGKGLPDWNVLTLEYTIAHPEDHLESYGQTCCNTVGYNLVEREG